METALLITERHVRGSTLNQQDFILKQVSVLR